MNEKKHTLYRVDINKFKKGKMFDSVSFKHRINHNIKIYPFLTLKNINPSEDFTSVCARIINKLNGKTPKLRSIEDYATSNLKYYSKIDDKDLPIYYDVFKNIFFKESGEVQVKSLILLQLLEVEETNDNYLADFLTDVLGDFSFLKERLIESLDYIKNHSNIMYKSFYDSITYNTFSYTNINYENNIENTTYDKKVANDNKLENESNSSSVKSSTYKENNVLSNILFSEDDESRKFVSDNSILFTFDNVDNNKLHNNHDDNINNKDNYISNDINNLNENIDKNQGTFNNYNSQVVSKKVIQGNNNLFYSRIYSGFKTTFEEDFAYILKEESNDPNLFIQLFEFYFYSYIIQATIMLDKKMDGNRNEIYPLYYALDWEMVSISRKCVEDINGYKKVERVLKNMFVHSAVLELLNYTDSEFYKFDYIRLNELVRSDVDEDKRVSDEIYKIADEYRHAIEKFFPKDIDIINRVTKDLESDDYTFAALKYLYELVKIQFDETDKYTTRVIYFNNFRFFLQKYSKNRGRSGQVLNITQEMLIFLNKICIKNNQEMRLNTFFEECEKRGIFFDNISKDQIALYFEKSNLIEKKSDSGDAKYVKRII